MAPCHDDIWAVEVHFHLFHTQKYMNTSVQLDTPGAMYRRTSPYQLNGRLGELQRWAGRFEGKKISLKCQESHSDS